MKKQTAFWALLVLATGVAIYWLFTHHPQHPQQPPNQAALANQSQSVKNAVVSKSALNQPAAGQPSANATASISEAVKEYVEKSMADPQYDWKQPIDFYGRVVDENNVPVANASVHFEWNDISEKGTSDATATSDSNGYFSLVDRRGKRLYVDVGKEGYYSSGDARNATFEYANPADGLFTPNPNNPVVFHLRKKGVGADLITSEYGVKPYFGVTIPLDGTPVQVDLLERKIGQGTLVISQLKPEYKN